MNELSIWTIKGDEAEEVEAVDVSKVDLTERRLEETLVRRPDMLELDLRLVGRQTPTDGGPSDLLGVDTDGRLVVFELKRGSVTRDAVTQCIDYASALDAMDPKKLAKHIEEHSGTHGIEQIPDFKAWYHEHYKRQYEANELEDLLSPRLVLVGLGVDENAERMARFLQAGKIDISVLTFYGFRHGGETLLARQVEVEAKDDESDSSSRHGGSKTASEKREDLKRRIQESGMPDLFESIEQTITAALGGARKSRLATGIGFYMPFGSGRSQILHIWVSKTGGFYLEFHASTKTYDTADFSTITEKAIHFSWRDRGDNFDLFIKDAEDWELKRSDVTDFLKEAASLRLKAPTTDAP